MKPAGSLSHPWLTWIGVAVSLSSLLPFLAVQMGWLDPKGSVGDFAGWALYLAPFVGLLCLMVAAVAGEKGKKLRAAFVVIYLVWIVLLAGAWALSLTNGIRRGPGGDGFFQCLSGPMRSC